MNKLLIIIGILALTLLLGTCSNGSDETTISISFGMDNAPGRAAVSIDELRHEISLYGPTGKQTLSISGPGTARATVVPGTWHIEVEGYLGDNLYSEGSAIAEVRVGRNTSVLVHMIVILIGDGSGGGGSPPGPAYGISLSESGTLAFTAVGEGYYLEPLTVTITNIGSNGTGSLNVGITGIDSSSFSIILSPPISNIPPGGTHTFTVVQTSGLGAGTYNDATVTVDDGGVNGISESFGLSFTVLVPDGTPAAPWLVTNDVELAAVGTGSPAGWDPDKSYKQTGPINITTPWTPIGGPFTGSYDGGGNTINLPSIISPSGVYAGLFSQIGSSGEVKNLAMKGTVTVNFSDPSYCFAGVVAGDNNGTIRNVSSSVVFTASNSIDGIYIGGIAGICNAAPGIIKNCYSTNDITGSSSVYLALGGILGRWQSPGSVSYCWAEGSLYTGTGYAGGIIGSNGSSGHTTTNCVALHGSFSPGGTPLDCRIVGAQNDAGLSDNFANASMVNSGAWGNVGHDMANGEGVAISATEATAGAWWTGAGGPKWAAFWGGADPDETKPWHWDNVNLRPMLWFESTVNR